MRNESSLVVDETKKRLKSLQVRWNWPIANGFELRVCRSYSIAVQYMAEKFHIVLEKGAFRRLGMELMFLKGRNNLP